MTACDPGGVGEGRESAVGSHRSTSLQPRKRLRRSAEALEATVRVAVFTDNDFEKVNGVTTTLKAVLRFIDPAVQPRVYTAASLGVQTPSYFAAGSVGAGLPLYPTMRIYWPRVRAFSREIARHHVDVVHTTTPGPVGLAARWLAARLGVPLVGSYHTEFGDYAAALSGSTTLGRAVDRSVRWYYRPCDPLLVPSAATRDQLIARGYDATRLIVWSRGVDAGTYSRHTAPRQRFERAGASMIGAPPCSMPVACHERRAWP